MLAIIKQIKEKIKVFLNWILDILGKDSVFFILLIILASSISFFLGAMSEFETKKDDKISSIEFVEGKNGNPVYYVASKNGKRYYLPWCYTGKKENIVKFETREKAEKSGYTPSKNCEGL